MRDVAAVAGVGISTVSRVINKSPVVIPETVAHVTKVMNEMGYRASSTGRSSGKNKKQGGALSAKAVCIILSEHKNLKWMTNCAPIYAYAIHGAEAALNERGITCIIRQVSPTKRTEEFKQLAVDGFLVLGNDEWQEWPDELRKLPSVKMLGLPSIGWCDCVSYNHDTIGQLAAQYLFDQNIKHTAVFGSSGNEVFNRRVSAFSKYVTQMGGTVRNLTSDKILLEVLEDSNAPKQAVVRALVDQLLQGGPDKPKGVFVTADLLAPVLYRELERRGVAPGKDIKVVSCNNEKPYLLPLHPAPAVIDLQAELIGQQAVERLLWRIGHPSSPYLSLIMEPTLVLPENPA